MNRIGCTHIHTMTNHLHYPSVNQFGDRVKWAQETPMSTYIHPCIHAYITYIHANMHIRMYVFYVCTDKFANTNLGAIHAYKTCENVHTQNANIYSGDPKVFLYPLQGVLIHNTISVHVWIPLNWRQFERQSHVDTRTNCVCISIHMPLNWRQFWEKESCRHENEMCVCVYVCQYTYLWIGGNLGERVMSVPERIMCAYMYTSIHNASELVAIWENKSCRYQNELCVCVYKKGSCRHENKLCVCIYVC